MSEDLKLRIENAKTKLKKAETEKTRKETEKEQAEKQLQEVIEQMKEEGVTPETIAAEIEGLEKDIEDSLNTIESLIPEV